jgi:hypothetical protein
MKYHFGFVEISALKSGFQLSTGVSLKLLFRWDHYLNQTFEVKRSHAIAAVSA